MNKVTYTNPTLKANQQLPEPPATIPNTWEEAFAIADDLKRQDEEHRKAFKEQKHKQATEQAEENPLPHDFAPRLRYLAKVKQAKREYYIALTKYYLSRAAELLWLIAMILAVVLGIIGGLILASQGNVPLASVVFGVGFSALFLLAVLAAPLALMLENVEPTYHEPVRNVAHVRPRKTK